MPEVNLSVELREDTGKQKAKALRRNGQIPATYYAHDQKTISLSVDTYSLRRLLQKEINILNIAFPDGEKKKTIIRDLQRDPVTDELLHVDFMGIKLDEKIKMTIPVILTGTPTGVKVQGGILEHPLREVEVEGLPLDIPEHIEVDVTELEIGGVKTLEEIETKGKYRFLTDPTHPVAIVAQAKVVKALEEEEEGLAEELEEAAAEQEGEKGEKEEKEES
ncbi:50S ribosomal protein L25 [bacterium]|nr:50S ribosomal protein L25 [bacterium]